MDALGPVDVLCAHIPPDLPELLYDVEARRFERGSEALRDYVERVQPDHVLFGHVHQPLVARAGSAAPSASTSATSGAVGEPYVLQW